MESTSLDYRQLFETVPGLYLILSPDLSIIAVNDAYTRATMTRREEILSRHLFDVFPDNPEDQTADGVSNLHASLLKVIRTRKPHTMAIQKYDIRRRDGSFEVRYWSPMNLPVLDESGELSAIIHRVEDVTEFVLLQEEKDREALLTRGLQDRLSQMEIEIVRRSREILRLNEQLERKVRERTDHLMKGEAILSSQNKTLQIQYKELEQFAYVASHDLQEPLRSLICFTELIQEEYSGKLGGNCDKYIDFILQSTRRMQNLVKGLLDYSRIGKEREVSYFNGHTMVQSVLADMTAAIEESHAHITLDPIPLLYGSQMELRLLFQNLISNAIKFRKKDQAPEIRISVKEQEDDLLFSVSDNGIGIDPQHAEKIFSIFKRLHNRSEFEGTGIGLSHCKKIVELHGGFIWVLSESGHGSTFQFTLPKHTAS